MIVYRELATLAKDLGISSRTLYAVSNSLSDHYIKTEIPKKDGTSRVLSVPDKVLKRIQRAINEVILSQEPISRYATAYRPAVSIRLNALPHVGKKRVLKLDIAHFFDSIRYSTVKNLVFPAERYSEQNRILLSMLCYYRDVLPQGAPSSPAITNIILRDFDEKVGAACDARGVSYTRYCDDMTFSGEFDADEIVSLVSKELKPLGLVLNKRKTVSASRGGRQSVTGIVVNEKLNVEKSYKRRIRQEMYFCGKYGVEAHLERLEADITPEKYLASLLGRINHVLQITPDNREFSEYKTAVIALIKKYS